MSELSPEAQPRADLRELLRHPIVRDAALVLVWFVGMALLCAVIWWQVTPLAEFTRTSTNAEMGEAELGRQVATDGWFFVIAAVAGLASGIVLLALRRGDPVAMVVMVALGAGLASWLMVSTGLWLGPADPKDAIAHAAVGAKVPMQLKPHAMGVVFVWPVAALVGALGVLWGLDESRSPARSTSSNDGVSSPYSG